MESKHHCVLVVEDHDINQELIYEMLKRLGCHVDIASNGKEALQYLAQQTYDAIFMDLQMPEMDGYETTREIRKLEAGKSIPIIALTANHRKKDLDLCLVAGMNDYLTKPFVLDDLAALLQKHL
jgi:CheY-like chemotaxis protein